MSILISDMEMPTSCYDCPLCYDMMECRASTIRFYNMKEQAFDFCIERHPDCPLASVDDVRLVVHGEWGVSLNPCFSPFDGSGEYRYWCNQCRHIQDYESNFCPYCGADMRGAEP